MDPAAQVRHLGSTVVPNHLTLYDFQNIFFLAVAAVNDGDTFTLWIGLYFNWKPLLIYGISI